MVALFRSRRKFLRATIAGAAMLGLAACDPISVGGFDGGRVGASDPVDVALLVPQTGSAAGLAGSLENAARLAIADLSGVEIRLAVYDTGGSADGAAVAARAAASDGAQVILGPVFADAAAAAGAAVRGRGINVLSFSNNPAVAGGNVYILGSTFQNTADRLASYAARQGILDVAIVQGDSAAESIGAAAISRALATSGVRLATTASFPLSQNGIVNAVPGIANQIKASGATGVFLTSGNDGALPFLVELLPNEGVSNQTHQLIGLQRLDIPATAVDLAGLQGAWFATPDPGLQSQFSARYQNAFGNAPHPLAGLAYDGVAAIGALATTGSATPFDTASITRPAGFAGVNGVFRLNPNGTNTRSLAVAQIQNRQVVILDPAQRSFGGVGF